MTININEAKAVPVAHPAAADPVPPKIYNVGKDTKDFVNTEYLTVDITNGKEANLDELRKQFPRIKIFKVKNLFLCGNYISLYRFDRKLGVKK